VFQNFAVNSLLDESILFCGGTVSREEHTVPEEQTK
jgi:hypothetical protein